MRIRTLVYTLFLIPVFYLSCVSTKEITEDYRTTIYVERMSYFINNPLEGGEVVFFGNSITQAGKWEYYFPNISVANRGISGDNTEGMLSRIYEVASSKPSKIFIMAGINDISLARTNKKIITNYRDIIGEIKKISPLTQIYIQSILPINNDFVKYRRLYNKESQIKSLNRMLVELTSSEGVEFINLYPFFENSEGKLMRDYTSDGLHLTDDAYYLWSNIIRNKIE